mmetsp:Transcript_19573/g.40269  ORF Transcript_19573/g.40269 Transcript_19573/m.40269 type:complete len:280 (-) Transcript_19573:117-956(-)
MRLDVSLKSGEEVAVDNVFVVESGKQHLFGKVLGFVIELRAHASLEGVVLLLDGLEKVLVSLCVVLFLAMDRLKVNDREVLLSVKSQKINTKNGKVIFGIGIPDGVVDLGVVTSVVISHADLAVFLGFEADIDDSSLFLLVRVEGKVRAFLVRALDDFEIGKVFFHEIHLPFPEGHVQEFIFDTRVDGGLPGHAVFRLGFSDRSGSLFCRFYLGHERQLLGETAHGSLKDVESGGVDIASVKRLGGARSSLGIASDRKGRIARLVVERVSAGHGRGKQK